MSRCTERAASCPLFPFKYRSGNSAKLEWEKVNEVTWKLTDGTMTNVPASHGQWGGHRTSKSLASIINIAPGKWLARCRDETDCAS